MFLTVSCEHISNLPVVVVCIVLLAITYVYVPSTRTFGLHWNQTITTPLLLRHTMKSQASLILKAMRTRLEWRLILHNPVSMLWMLPSLWCSVRVMRHRYSCSGSPSNHWCSVTNPLVHFQQLVYKLQQN